LIAEEPAPNDCTFTLLARHAIYQAAEISECNSGVYTEGTMGTPIAASNFRIRFTAEEVLLTVASELLE
jgi:hypothetical protein